MSQPKRKSPLPITTVLAIALVVAACVVVYSETLDNDQEPREVKIYEKDAGATKPKPAPNKTPETAADKDKHDTLVIETVIKPILRRAEKNKVYKLQQQMLRQRDTTGIRISKVWIYNANKRVFWYLIIEMANSMVHSKKCAAQVMWYQLHRLATLKFFRTHSADTQSFIEPDNLNPMVMHRIVKLNSSAYECKMPPESKEPKRVKTALDGSAKRAIMRYLKKANMETLTFLKVCATMAYTSRRGECWVSNEAERTKWMQAATMAYFIAWQDDKKKAIQQYLEDHVLGWTPKKPYPKFAFEALDILCKANEKAYGCNNK